MHLGINLFIIYAVYRWGNWRNWKEYHSTMLFFAFMNMLYNFMTTGYRLWVMRPDLFVNFKITEILHTSVTFTGTTLIFLSRHPENSVTKKVIYNVKWILVYFTLETIFYATGRIQYKNGWILLYSLIFLSIMFPGLYLHYKRPLLAYIVFISVTVAGILYFNVPIAVPWYD
jgi:hypothetical protein